MAEERTIEEGLNELAAVFVEFRKFLRLPAKLPTVGERLKCVPLRNYPPVTEWNQKQGFQLVLMYAKENWRTLEEAWAALPEGLKNRLILKVVALECEPMIAEAHAAMDELKWQVEQRS